MLPKSVRDTGDRGLNEGEVVSIWVWGKKRQGKTGAEEHSQKSPGLGRRQGLSYYTQSRGTGKCWVENSAPAWPAHWPFFKSLPIH